jgi:hypothetical protein
MNPSRRALIIKRPHFLSWIGLIIAIGFIPIFRETVYVNSISIHAKNYVGGSGHPALGIKQAADDPSALHTAYLPLVLQRIPNRLYWGAYTGEVPMPQSFQPGGSFYNLENAAQKNMSIVHWGQSWQRNGNYQQFFPAHFDNVRNHGSIPLVDWGSQNDGGGVNQPDFRLSEISQGRHDAYIRQWAQDAKNWGHPFFLRFDWEMNGNWKFPWSEQLNGNQPGDFITAWRHVHDIFTEVGANNVSWVWCPNYSSPVTLTMESLYPGDTYIDWTCLDAYNKEDEWVSFQTLMSGNNSWIYDSYTEISTVAPSKPIMIGETASIEAEDGGSKKAAWITDLLGTQLLRNYPKIKALVWFNHDDGNPAYTFPIQSSQLSIDAFAGGILSKNYMGNTYSTLDASPIPPP